MVSHHNYPSAYASSASDLHLPPSSASAVGAPVHHARAASVTSGRSSTRRHRHARTHHGGSSAYLPQNEFPVFSHTGDVDIIVRSASGKKENRYLLHRLILSQCSGFFEAGTREVWTRPSLDQGGGSLATIGENSVAGGSSRASSTERRPGYEQVQPKQRWRYELDWQAAGDDEAPMLVQSESGSSQSIFGNDGRTDRPPPVRSKPPTSNDGFFRSMTNFSALSLNSHPQTSSSTSAVIAGQPDEPGDEVLKDYDNLFRTMYQYPPVLDTINIATAYTECKALLHLADMYDALEIAGSRVDHHLLRFGARLFKQIAKYPPSYLKLGYLARSRTIFTEALIHVVGQWPLAAPQLRHGQLDRDVTDLIEDKVEDLEDVKARVEGKLWRLTLTTSRGERVSPTNDYLGWLAMSLFRQWLAENTTPLPVGILKTDAAAGAQQRPGSGSQVSASNAAGGGGVGGGGARRAGSRSSSANNHIASQRVTSNQQQRPSASEPYPNAGRIYRILGSTTASAYLAHDELKRFLKLSPDLYTRENLKKFERRVEELKNLARDTVKPLMRNLLELDMSSFGPGGLGYLTCTRVQQQDLPWEE